MAQINTVEVILKYYTIHCNSLPIRPFGHGPMFVEFLPVSLHAMFHTSISNGHPLVTVVYNINIESHV